MHDEMAGWYEVRLTGPRREQFRLFCLLWNGTQDDLARRRTPRSCDRSDYRHAQTLAHNLHGARVRTSPQARRRSQAELPATDRNGTLAQMECAVTRPLQDSFLITCADSCHD